MNAADILKAALGHTEDRAATYDKPEGERSMPATVAAFNALTGHSLNAEQGWLFMTVLKLCRTQQGAFRADNYEDGSAYFALMGEQAASDRLLAKATDFGAVADEPIDPNRSKGYGPCDEHGWRDWNGKLAIPHGDVEVRNRAGSILKGRGELFDWSLSEQLASEFDIVEWRWKPVPPVGR